MQIDIRQYHLCICHFHPLWVNQGSWRTVPPRGGLRRASASGPAGKQPPPAPAPDLLRRLAQPPATRKLHLTAGERLPLRRFGLAARLRRLAVCRGGLGEIHVVPFGVHVFPGLTARASLLLPPPVVPYDPAQPVPTPRPGASQASFRPRNRPFARTYNGLTERDRGETKPTRQTKKGVTYVR